MILPPTLAEGASFSAQFNVPGVLSDPAIAVFSGRTRVAANDNGRSDGPATVAELQNAAARSGPSISPTRTKPPPS